MAEEKPLSPEEALKKIRADFQAMLESRASLSILLHARYDALVKAGFSEPQAFDIIKARGLG